MVINTKIYACQGELTDEAVLAGVPDGTPEEKLAYFKARSIEQYAQMRELNPIMHGQYDGGVWQYVSLIERGIEERNTFDHIDSKRAGVAAFEEKFPLSFSEAREVYEAVERLKLDTAFRTLKGHEMWRLWEIAAIVKNKTGFLPGPFPSRQQISLAQNGALAGKWPETVKRLLSIFNRHYTRFPEREEWDYVNRHEEKVIRAERFAFGDGYTLASIGCSELVK